MNFLALQNETMTGRFKEAERSRVILWLQSAYESLWNAADWEFKRVPATTLNVVAGNRLPTMPGNLSKVLTVFDTYGQPLTYMPPDEWETLFVGDTSTGTPDAFTVINRQIYLGPTPRANAAFKISYRRVLSHFPADGVTVTTGTMTADTDLPLWSSDHHEILTFLATVEGRKKQGDPRWQDDQNQADVLLQAMLEDLTPDRGGVPVQYARDPL